MAVYDELRIGKEKIINRFEIYPLLGGEILWARCIGPRGSWKIICLKCIPFHFSEKTSYLPT